MTMQYPQGPLANVDVHMQVKRGACASAVVSTARNYANGSLKLPQERRAKSCCTFWRLSLSRSQCSQ